MSEYSHTASRVDLRLSHDFVLICVMQLTNPFPQTQIYTDQQLLAIIISTLDLTPSAAWVFEL